MRSLLRVAACGALVATVAGVAAPASASDREYRTTVGLAPLGTYATGIFDESAAEIVSYDAPSRRGA